VHFVNKLLFLQKNEDCDQNSASPEKRRRTEALDDEETLFCKSIVHTLRRLNPKQKAFAKLQILKVLYEAEFGNDEDKQWTNIENTVKCVAQESCKMRG
jgi:BESS motif